MEKNQKINCTVQSCTWNNSQRQECELEQIIVEPCANCNTGKPQDESMCASYECKSTK